MKRVTLRVAAPAMILIVIGGIAMLRPFKSWFSRKPSDVGTLIECSCSSGGGMTGGHSDIRLKQTADGITLTIEDQPWFGALIKTTVYRADDDALAQVQAHVDRFDLTRWVDLPPTDLIVLDAPSIHYELDYDNTRNGGRATEYYVIDGDVQPPKGDEGALYELSRLMTQWAEDDRLLSRTWTDTEGNVIDVDALKAPDGSWTCPFCHHAGNTGWQCEECRMERPWVE